jgi:hypothetical protein
MTNTTTSTTRQQGNGGQLLAAATRRPQQVELEDHQYQEGNGRRLIVKMKKPKQ